MTMAEQMQPMPDVPERCPLCHSPVAERFPHAVIYDCGYARFTDGQPVTDDYPAECQRRRIKLLEKQLTAARAEVERLRAENERLYRRIEGLEAKVARQRAVISRLQAAIERRNSEERIEALRRALHDETLERYMREYDAAADEAERWRKQYEALRAKVESVAQELRKRAYSCAKDWLETGHHYHDGASDAYYMAEEMVWRLLSEAGGGDT